MSAPRSHDATNPVIASHGTLVVAIATPAFIVIATDSRRTDERGAYDDQSKKLFRVGKRRILAIAGLAGVKMANIPGLTEETAPLLDKQISYFYGFGESIDDRFWNDPPAPNYPGTNREVKEMLERQKDDNPYIWWTTLAGPIQTVLNIAETFRGTDLTDYRLDAVLAGFKSNGEAKIERFSIEPVKGTSSWGRPAIGLARYSKRQL